MFDTIVLVFKHKDQVLIGCVHIEIDIVIFCRVFSLDHTEFIARVFNLYLADLGYGIFFVQALLTEVKVVVV